MLSIARLVMITLGLSVAGLSAQAKSVALKTSQKVKAEELAGTYFNAKGDRIVVTVLPDEKEQEDLFSREYLVTAVVTFANLSGEFETTERVGEELSEADLTFRIGAECEDPGCEEYSVEMIFSKNAAGEFSVEASIDYLKVIDDEDMPENEAQAKEMCSYLTGKEDKIDVEISDDAVFCRFSDNEVILNKKSKKSDLAKTTSYRCDGFAGVEEYRSFIDTKAGTADFFDNDETTDMVLVKTENLESLPPQTRYIFESDDYGNGILRLYFTLPSLEATLISIDHEDVTETIGTVTCTAL